MVESVKRATVSVALIVKDEAATLNPCLKSVRDVVDEIVVLVDDRTTDRTFEIAKKYADIVEYFKWSDFSTARNASIKKCGSEWILIMDGHEVLHPKSKPILTNLLERVLPQKDLSDTGMFSAFVYMNPKGKGNIEEMIPDTFFLQPRLFINNGDYAYTGRVHNWLNTKAKSKLQKRPVNELVFIHKRTEKNSKLRKEERRNVNIPALKLDIKDNPKSPRPYFYLGNAYNELEEWEEALSWYKKYLKLSTWGAERAHAMLMMGTIYAQKKEYKEATQILKEAIKEDWERAEIYLVLGDIAFDQKDLYQAEHWWKSAIEMKPPMNNLFLHGPAYTYMPHQSLAKLYSTVGEWMKALQHAEKAISLGCANQDMISKMAIWKTKLGLDSNKKNIILYDENNQFAFLKDIRRNLTKKFNVATSVEYDTEQAGWADVVWFEWCNKNILRASEMVKPEGQTWIVRLHGYEVFNPDRMTYVNWSKIDVLIFVADHIRKHFDENYWIPDNVKTVVIPNGVDLNRWSFAKREYSKQKNIGIIGILTEKKGPLLLAKVIRHFSKTHPDYRFLLRFDSLKKPNVFEHVLRYELRDLTNWEWIDRVESIDSWMEDLKFLISTSVLESFSYVVAEAMAKGIKPLIHDFKGSRDLYPAELIWRDIDELEKVFDGEYKSDEYRKWIEDHYSIDKQMKQIFELLEDKTNKENNPQNSG